MWLSLECIFMKRGHDATRVKSPGTFIKCTHDSPCHRSEMLHMHPPNLSSLLRHAHMWALTPVIATNSHWKQILGISFIVFPDHVCIQVMLGSKKNIHTDHKEQRTVSFSHVCGKLIALFVLVQNALFKIKF